MFRLENQFKELSQNKLLAKEKLMRVHTGLFISWIIFSVADRVNLVLRDSLYYDTVTEVACKSDQYCREKLCPQIAT